MTQVATTASLPNMDKLELAFNGRDYKVEQRNGAFFVRQRPQGGNYGQAQ